MSDQSTSPTILIMIDGLRPDARLHCNLPNFEALRARSAWSLGAQSVMPCITLPCHTSIFHSVPPSRHGITQNLWQPMARPVPGLFDVAKAANKICASIYNWEPLRDLGRPEALDFAWYQNLTYQHDGDDILTDAALEHLARRMPDFAFIYLGTVDTAGHYYGWMSEGYLAQAERVDGNLGRILAALPKDAHVLLQADHGGHDRNHGENVPEDMTIPWMVAGPKVTPGEISEQVTLLDTAPTLATLMGLTIPRDWEGTSRVQVSQ